MKKIEAQLALFGNTDIMEKIIPLESDIWGITNIAGLGHYQRELKTQTRGDGTGVFVTGYQVLQRDIDINILSRRVPTMKERLVWDDIYRFQYGDLYLVYYGEAFVFRECKIANISTNKLANGKYEIKMTLTQDNPLWVVDYYEPDEENQIHFKTCTDDTTETPPIRTYKSMGTIYGATLQAHNKTDIEALSFECNNQQIMVNIPKGLGNDCLIKLRPLCMMPNVEQGNAVISGIRVSINDKVVFEDPYIYPFWGDQYMKFKMYGGIADGETYDQAYPGEKDGAFDVLFNENSSLIKTEVGGI